MSERKPKVNTLRKIKDSSMVVFWCPGCDEAHQIDTAVWGFNGDYEKPTFTPSYLTWNDPNPNADPKYDPDGKYRDGFRCHSFITDGVIQYLGDCTHILSGQSVPLPDWPMR